MLTLRQIQIELDEVREAFFIYKEKDLIKTAVMTAKLNFLIGLNIAMAAGIGASIVLKFLGT